MICQTFLSDLLSPPTSPSWPLPAWEAWAARRHWAFLVAKGTSFAFRWKRTEEGCWIRFQGEPWVFFPYYGPGDPWAYNGMGT